MVNTPPWPAAKQRAVDVVARLHQRRNVDFRKAQRLGKNDGLFTWKRGCQQLGIFTNQEWKVLPATIQVRLLHFIIDVPFRPKRSEPRAIKRRPKPYPLLHKPRRQFKEIPHRTRYWKNNPRKS